MAPIKDFLNSELFGSTDEKASNISRIWFRLSILLVVLLIVYYYQHSQQPKQMNYLSQYFLLMNLILPRVVDNYLNFQLLIETVYLSQYYQHIFMIVATNNCNMTLNKRNACYMTYHRQINRLWSNLYMKIMNQYITMAAQPSYPHF